MQNVNSVHFKQICLACAIMFKNKSFVYMYLWVYLRQQINLPLIIFRKIFSRKILPLYKSVFIQIRISFVFRETSLVFRKVWIKASIWHLF